MMMNWRGGTGSGGERSAVDARLQQGDIVVHSAREWPFVGVVQAADGGGRSLACCPSCGKPKQDAADGWGDDSGRDDEDAPDCCADDPSLTETQLCVVDVLAEAALYAQEQAAAEAMDATETRPDNDTEMATPGRDSGHAESTSSPSVEATLVVGPQWRVIWHPTLESTAPDGCEIVVGTSRQQFYQDGQSIQRKGAAETDRRAIIKAVSQESDALVLPDCKFVICGLLDSQTVPVQDVDASPGNYLIYDGWLGSVAAVVHRVTLRTADGLEFWLTDDSHVIDTHFSDAFARSEADAQHVDPRMVYVGASLCAPYLVLRHATWCTPLPDQQLQALAPRIADSESNYDKLNATSDTSGVSFSQPSVERAHVAGVPKRKTGIPVGSTTTDGGATAEEMPMESATDAAADCQSPLPKLDLMRLTVSGVDTIKIDVEWRCTLDGSERDQPDVHSLEGAEIARAMHYRIDYGTASLRSVGSRYRHQLQTTDCVLSVDDWRLLRTGGEQQKPVTRLPDELHTADYVHLYQLTSAVKLDVLWEDGSMEYGLTATDVQLCRMSELGRDYFPGMYVTLANKKALTAADEPDDERLDDGKNRFGLILEASNGERFARVRWLRHASADDGSRLFGVDPSVEADEELSFYDLKTQNEYNYVRGSLVASVLRDWPQRGVGRPNVGHVLGKLVDGTVRMRWFGDSESSVAKPWMLQQLRVADCFGSYSSNASEADDADAYANNVYSPTEHEWDDVEDMRYYDYGRLDETERDARIALLLGLVAPALALLQRLVVSVHHHLPALERKQLLRLALHCDDVVSGLASCAHFRPTLSQFFRDQLGVGLDEPPRDSTAPDSDVGADGRSAADGELLWSMSTWMFDWLEVTGELQLAVSKKRSAVTKDEHSTTTDSSTTSFADLPLNSTELSAEFADEQADSRRDDLLTRMSDTVNSLQTAFSVLPQVLFQPLDSTGPLVADCVRTLQSALVGPADGGASGDCAADVCASLPPEVAAESLKASNEFMRIFRKSKLVAQVPCFNYTLPNGRDMRTLVDSWTPRPMVDREQTFVESDASADPLAVMRAETAFLEQSIKSAPTSAAQYMSVCHRVADALVLATVLLLRPLVGVIRARLSEAAVRSFERLIAGGDPFEPLPAAAAAASAAAGPGGDVAQPPLSADDEFGAALSPASFDVMSSAPAGHRFHGKPFDATLAPKAFLKAALRELKMLESSLPPGIYVKAYENRFDLFSAMIVGPEGTPYAHSMFFFDVRLKDNYPVRPPEVFFKSMSKRLNPNLYEDGMVCLSLLGTWEGKETELWSPKSTLLQVFLSIQSLVLVPDPYYLEPGYEKERGTADGDAKARDYNASALLAALEALERAVSRPPEPFEPVVRQQFVENGARLLELLETCRSRADQLPYPLHPVTRGFALSVKRHSDLLKRMLARYRATVSSQ